MASKGEVKRKRKFGKEERAEKERELREACLRGHAGLVRALLKQGVDPECGRTDILRGKDEKKKWSPLIFASLAGCKETVQVLVEYGADIRQVDAFRGRTALHWACKRGHYNLAWYLIQEKGIDPRQPDREGRTALMHASWWGHEKLVKYLLSGVAGANINTVDNVRGWNALLGACKYGKAGVVELLLKKDGVDVDMGDCMGRPPLLHVHDSRIAHLLLEKGAKYNCVDAVTGRNVLHWASEDGNLPLVQVVIQHTLQVRRDPKQLRELLCKLDKLTGCTPLALAQRRGHKQVVSELRACSFHIYQDVMKSFAV